MFWKGKRTSADESGPQSAIEKGLVIFNTVEEAIKAEKLVRKNDLYCRLLAPPPELRKGCDLALEIRLVELPVINRILVNGVPHQGIYPVKGNLELLDVVKVTHYEGYTMVKAGNMKLTFDDITGMIVNVSGGGCPDIPFLNIQLVGKRLDQAPRPKDIGATLCALMLDRALEESFMIWEENKKC